MGKDSWKDIFHVVPGVVRLPDCPPLSGWAIIYISTGETVGTYIGKGYAIKQARYRHKKIVRKIDKLFLG